MNESINPECTKEHLEKRSCCATVVTIITVILMGIESWQLLYGYWLTLCGCSHDGANVVSAGDRLRIIGYRFIILHGEGPRPRNRDYTYKNGTIRDVFWCMWRLWRCDRTWRFHNEDEITVIALECLLTILPLWSEMWKERWRIHFCSWFEWGIDYDKPARTRIQGTCNARIVTVLIMERYTGAFIRMQSGRFGCSLYLERLRIG